MEWLLILSALLNAATGAFTGTRGPETPARHEASVEAVAVAESVVAAVAPAIARPAAASGPDRSGDSHPAVADPPMLREPLETDRLIE